MSQKITYPFIKSWIRQHNRDCTKKIIDFGCGSGDLVAEIRSDNMDAEGIEVDFFHESILKNFDQDLLTDKKIHVINSTERLNELAGKYDLLVSHMVYEHVKDKDEFIRQIALLLNKNGKALLMFPTVEVLREGHIQQFLIHRLPNNKFRYLYCQALLGIGYKKSREISIKEYIVGKFEDIDERCSYEHNKLSIDRFRKCFNVTHLEPEYVRYRLNIAGLNITKSLIKNDLIRILFTKLLQYYSFTVIVIEKC
jgi:SAM-dependent methyltransferase